MKSSSSANATISSKRSAISRFVRPSIMPLMKTFSRPEISGWKPAPSSISAETRPWTVTVPVVGLPMPAMSLSIVLLPGPVAPDDAERLPAGDVERHALQRVESLVGPRSRSRLPREQRALQRARTACGGRTGGRPCGRRATSIAMRRSHFLRERVAQAVEHEVAQRGTARADDGDRPAAAASRVKGPA